MRELSQGLVMGTLLGKCLHTSTSSLSLVLKDICPQIALTDWPLVRTASLDIKHKHLLKRDSKL